MYDLSVHSIILKNKHFKTPMRVLKLNSYATMNSLRLFISTINK